MKTIKPSLIITLSLFSMQLVAQESWMIDINGCKVYHSNPEKNQSVEWIGNCIDSIAEGYGQLVWHKNNKRTNITYTGYMQNGRPEGKGKYETDSGFVKETFEGVFQDGELTFGTIYTYTKHDTLKYVGEITNWKANGKGVMSFSNGDWFNGKLKDGYFIDGTLTLISFEYKIESSGWKYYSTTKGTLTWSDGTVYSGELKSNLPHGKGMVVYPDGYIEYGKWRNGVLKRIINNGI